MKPTPSSEALARLLDALCFRHAQLGLRRSAAARVQLELDGAQIELQLAAPHSEDAFARIEQVALRWELVAGERPEQARLDAVLAALARSLPALGAMMLGGTIDPLDAGDPLALLPAAAAARQAWLEHRWAPHVDGLPPCLDIELRPLEPTRALVEAHAPPEPCDDCAHAMWCPANAQPAQTSRATLRPLRHHEPGAAMLAALRTIYAAWERPPEGAASAWVHEALAMRRGVLSGPPLPFELSLKRVEDRLAPLVRLVDMLPMTPPSWSTHEGRARARRRRLRSSARALNEGDCARAIDAFIELSEAQLGLGAGMSYGLEVPITGGAPRTQLYAHMSRDNERNRAFARAAMAWAGAEPEQIERVMQLSAGRILALVTHAPTPGDPRRVKLYVNFPLDTEDPVTGLEPLARPAYAPSHGLAVFQIGAQGTGWEKWDFRCTTHFQRFEPVVDDFIRGMRERDAQRVRRILDGADFAPWPTWVSMRPRARTLYFNPR